MTSGAPAVPHAPRASASPGPPHESHAPQIRSSASDGSLDQYLKEISRFPLIDRAEEARLAGLIRTGDGEALNALVRANLRFVVSVAKKYQNQGVPLSDLINEGNLGLIRAAHKFDETKGIKFISYAVWWIRQAILQALAEQSRIVRVPLNRAGALHRIGRRSATLLQELGREPTVEEIADGLDLSEEEVASAMTISQSHLSLDAPRDPGEDNRLLDYLPDQFAENPEGGRVRAGAEGVGGGCTLLAPGAGGEGPSPLLRARRPGAHDPRGDRRPPGDHPGAGAPDQGEGSRPTPPRLPGPIPRAPSRGERSSPAASIPVRGPR
jgi:RNA polymerase primary sigma factor